MSVFDRRIIASLLLLTYGLIAVAGHGLHALAPCGDPDCGDSAVVCECGCHHDSSSAAPSDSDGKPAFARESGEGHNPHTCAFCTLLAKVKVGHSSTVSTSLVEQVVQTSSVLPSIVVAATHDSSHSPRGPPATA